MNPTTILAKRRGVAAALASIERTGTPAEIAEAHQRLAAIDAKIEALRTRPQSANSRRRVRV